MRFMQKLWSDEAQDALGVSLGDDSDAIRAQVERGEAVLWHSPVARSWLITRLEDHELVIVCFAGRGARAMFRSMYQCAQMLGKRAVRFHTSQSWMLDVVQEWKPKALEYVVTVPVSEK
jgi:hypothetical protein